MQYGIDIVEEVLGIEHTIIIRSGIYQNIVIIARKVVQPFGNPFIGVFVEIYTALFLSHVFFIYIERKDISGS